jgi:hypothetical protein
MKNSAWTYEEAAQLVRLVRQGAATAKIVADLHRSTYAVNAMRRKMHTAIDRGYRGTAIARMILMGEQALTLLPLEPRQLPASGTVTRVERRPTLAQKEAALEEHITARVIQLLRKDFDSFRAEFFERMMADAAKRESIQYDLKEAQRTREAWRTMMSGFGARMEYLEKQFGIAWPKPDGKIVQWWQAMIDETVCAMTTKPQARSRPARLPAARGGP